MVSAITSEIALGMVLSKTIKNEIWILDRKFHYLTIFSKVFRSLDRPGSWKTWFLLFFFWINSIKPQKSSPERSVKSDKSQPPKRRRRSVGEDRSPGSSSRRSKKSPATPPSAQKPISPGRKIQIHAAHKAKQVTWIHYLGKNTVRSRTMISPNLTFATAIILVFLENKFW